MNEKTLRVRITLDMDDPESRILERLLQAMTVGSHKERTYWLADAAINHLRGFVLGHDAADSMRSQLHRDFARSMYQAAGINPDQVQFGVHGGLPRTESAGNDRLGSGVAASESVAPVTPVPVSPGSKSQSVQPLEEQSVSGVAGDESGGMRSKLMQLM